ncbi:MAG: septal ring lytic transglycosylase RlpA family protein [Gammaproteobacteria bacterium]|nr:septal ring lytic transglycosylase RlpA family protein [Gammaproteobacteria bacterium]
MSEDRQLLPYLLMLMLALIGCAGDARYHRGDGPGVPIDVASIQSVVPRSEPRSRYGNPASYVVNGRRYHVMPSSEGYVAQGKASWYGRKFHGKRTSSGEAFNMYAMTAAHKSLPLPTYVVVTNRKNRQQAVVKVNDRGPFVDDRLIDLSYAAAAKLGILADGTGDVEIRALQAGQSIPSGASSPVAIAGDAVYVQLGAFQHRANAELLRAKASGADVRFTRVSQASSAQGAPVYRVLVGPLDSESEVQAVLGKLQRAGIGSYRLVTE